MAKDVFSTLGLQPSFGFGDRIGVATPGHVEAMKRAGGDISPIFPQQSIREMNPTGRTPHDVIDSAIAGMRHSAWNRPSGADADHLKSCEDVDAAVAAGFTFYTIDPSDHVDGNADDYDESMLCERFAPLRSAIAWYETYVAQRVPLPSGRSFTIDDQALKRCTVKYGRAIEHAITLAKYIRNTCRAVNRAFELEVSIDETRQPTSLAEHFVIVDQFQRQAIELTSVAPKFCGEFEKGVDYKGDIRKFERSLVDHALLAYKLGPYKLSLHSGSDKISLYPILAKATNGCFHVKTAGTSYLEALRVVAKHDESLFRRIINTARRHYDNDKATYYVSADLNNLPQPDDAVDVAQLEKSYLGRWSDVPVGQGFSEPGRQVLHCTFGTILRDCELGLLIRQPLRAHADTYTEFLADHFQRHLCALTEAL